MGRINRKKFLAFFGGALLPLALPFADRLRSRSLRKKYLRPPGALPEADFLKACIACAQCANVCPNDCIKFYGLEAGFEKFGTPRIDARAKGCILCMACTQACPTGALQPLEDNAAGRAAVKMGTARVARDYCYSYALRTCGVCYRSCPLAGTAITLGVFEQPTVHPEHCVGCGLCEQACVHMPQAIRVTPAGVELEA